jgi:glycosyltransferase involved in cell wall biosynthesis
MLIGIDGNEANIKNRVGSNVYAFELLRNLYRLQDEWKDKHKIWVYLKEKPLADLPDETPSFIYKVIPGSKLWIFTKLMPNLLFSAEKPDIFFTPSHYLPPLVAVPLVCSVTDLGYLEFSGQFTKKDFWQLKLWTAYSITVSKSIITISQSSKDDIVRHYTFASDKITVTFPAYDKSRFNTDVLEKDVRRIKEKYKIGDNYILFLSTLKPSKNIEGLVEAYASISHLQFPIFKKEGFKLVIAGKKGWLYETIFEKVRTLGLKNDIIFTDFVDEQDKPALIAGAKLFVLPSFWEGFGLDILNAMACGVPVVISKAGSLPEVGGEAAVYVNAEDTVSIAQGIKKVLSLTKKEYNILVEKGLAQAEKFSWEDTARKTLEILEDTQKR